MIGSLEFADGEREMPTRSWRGEQTLEDIVEAAWRLSDREGAARMLAGVTLGAVAEEAGMTRAGLSHHFTSREELALAMAESLVAGFSMAPVEEVTQWLSELAVEDVLDSLRVAAQANWNAHSRPDQLLGASRMLALYAGGIGPHAVGEVRGLAGARFLGQLLSHMGEVYEAALGRAGLRLIEPFTYHELARMLEGLGGALLVQHATQPGTIRDDLYADVVAVILSAITTPSAQPAEVQDLAMAFARQAAVVQRIDLSDWLDFLVDVAPAFVDGTDQVAFSALARAGGCPAGEIRETFGTVRFVAACCFVRHMVPVVEAASRNSSGPDRALSDVLCEISRWAAAEPYIAQALLAERLLARTIHGNEIGPADIRVLVPLAPVMSATMGHLTLPLPQLVRLGSSMAHTLLVHASTHVTEPPHVAAELASRLIPRGER